MGIVNLLRASPVCGLVAPTASRLRLPAVPALGAVGFVTDQILHGDGVTAPFNYP